MTEYQEKFQNLLRELFQFDSADLDFGIYRIMNYKREVVEKFITKDLPQSIAEELEKGELAEQAQITQELEQTADQIKETFSPDALDADGNLADTFNNTRLGQRYLELQARAAGARGRQTVEASIYNHLYTFFSRYYQDGDFISKRRYSKRQRYAIPYNGEEVYLYWANHDQYYIKTGEYFSDYTYSAPNGVSVHFKLQAADIEQDNVKGEKRFFVPLPNEITWDEETSQLVIPFEYRPLTGQEGITYGKTKQQEKILAQAVYDIPRQLAEAARALAALQTERNKDSQDEPVSYLEHHLKQYTRRNTSDFFIHKDLKGFLSQELDFYLKNEVLNLEELEAAGEGLTDGWFQQMRLIKAIGLRIIEFLAQIEEFQKMLWEKKKFVTETFYVVTIGQIPAAFYPEIAACEAQWDEWRTLGILENKGIKMKTDERLPFLKTHLSLPLDTRHFSPDFLDRLLISFDNLDDMTDGLLVHAENWQALHLLTEKYREQVKCVHIDPPYNTQTSGFLYKNDYQHSSWLAMMRDRILLSLRYLEKEGVFATHIDEFELERLILLLDSLRILDSGTLVWDKGMPTTGATGVATQHEYMLLRSNSSNISFRIRKKNISLIKAKILELLAKYGAPTKEAIAEYRRWLRSELLLSKAEKIYDQFDETGKPFRSRDMSATDKRSNPKFYIPLKHPITANDCPVPTNGWRYTPDSMEKFLAEGRIIFGADHTTIPRLKVSLETTPEHQLPSIYRSGQRGKFDLDALGVLFPFAHPLELYSYVIDTVAQSQSLIIDFFAGSGTTCHAVINLNREDGGRRKFILVEMADYFDTVLLPRIKKVTFTPEWKDGKPKRQATPEEAERSPRIMKVIRLESYEDALNNIAFEETGGQQAMQFEDYLLQYMLKWETRYSETLLNVEKMAKPFAYKLHIQREGQTDEKTVDLSETFNYLIGLHVETRRTYDNNRRRYLVYRGKVDQRKIAVIWRETEGWEQADYETDQVFASEHQLTKGADEVYVNGDSLIPNARALEGVFKARMFACVEG